MRLPQSIAPLLDRRERRRVLLALATGTFVYVGATILIPLSEGGRSRWVTFSVVLGFATFAVTAAEVNAAARRMLKEANSVTSILLPQKKTEADGAKP